MSTAATAQCPGHPAAALAYVSLDVERDLLGGDFPGRRIPGDGRLVAADRLTVREASLFFMLQACGFVIRPDLPHLVLHLRGGVLYFFTFTRSAGQTHLTLNTAQERQELGPDMNTMCILWVVIPMASENPVCSAFSRKL